MHKTAPKIYQDSFKSNPPNCFWLRLCAKLRKRHSKAKRRALAYQERCNKSKGLSKGSPKVSQTQSTRLFSRSKLCRIRGVFKSVDLKRFSSNCNRGQSRHLWLLRECRFHRGWKTKIINFHIVLMLFWSHNFQRLSSLLTR